MPSIAARLPTLAVIIAISAGPDAIMKLRQSLPIIDRRGSQVRAGAYQQFTP
jgi:hypothetical protein